MEAHQIPSEHGISVRTVVHSHNFSMPSSSRPSRPNSSSYGFTITELLISASVLSIFVMLALGAIVPAIKVTFEAEESIESQREVVLAFDRLVAEMGMADRATLTVLPEALSFLSRLEYRGSNPPISDSDMLNLNFSTPDHIWHKMVVLRRRNNHLWRREFPYTKNQALYQVLPDKLLAIADHTDRQEKIYVKNVELFDVTTAGSNRVQLKIRSVFREAHRPAACELNLQIQMRGGM